MLSDKKLLRIFFILVFLSSLFFLDEFISHFQYHVNGNIVNSVVSEEWHLVILNIVFFSALLIPLNFRRKIDWKEYGLVLGFFVSLFVEMYGIPFTIFLAYNLFHLNFNSNAIQSISMTVLSFDFLGVGLSMDIPMIYGSVLIILGIFLIVLGWISLYFGVKEKKLVKSGLYSEIRHPQYLGFILVILGWMIGWPTIIVLFFSPILIFKYINLAKKEELENQSKEYQKYKKETSFML